MATTSQILAWIELECTGWQREGIKGTRALLNEAHRMLLTARREQNILYDSTTGDLPYFATTDGVYIYDLHSAVNEAIAVVIDSPASLGYDQVIDENSSWVYEEYYLGSKLYYRIKNIRSWPATTTQAAKIMFIGVNPGTTTSCYRGVGYKKPTNITSDSIQHEMPGTTDIDYLLPATMKLIDAIDDHKKMEQAREYIELVLKPRMWKELDYGEQGQSSFCIKRRY